MATQGQTRSNARGGLGGGNRSGNAGVSGRSNLVSDVAPDESIGCLVGLTIMAFLFAIMLPVIMFMYIDMRTLRLENERITQKIGKYRHLIERCDR
jgi:hypothetical protein